MGHRHRHRPQLQQDPRPGHGPQWQHGLGYHHGLREQTRSRTSIWPSVVTWARDINTALSYCRTMGTGQWTTDSKVASRGSMGHRGLSKKSNSKNEQLFILATLSLLRATVTDRVPVQHTWGLNPNVSSRLLHTTLLSLLSYSTFPWFRLRLLSHLSTLASSFDPPLHNSPLHSSLFPPLH